MITVLVTHSCPRCEEAVARYRAEGLEPEVICLEDLPADERSTWCAEAVAAGWDMSFPCVIDGDGRIVDAGAD